mgnify:CR=1 FL=1
MSYRCYLRRKLQKTRPSEIMAILEDILERLDEKEAIISQSEAIVSKQKGHITTLKVEVAIQKRMIQELQDKPEMSAETEDDHTNVDISKNSRIKNSTRESGQEFI